MYITPQRRRRALECQKLRQQGYVIRDIATLLDVSPATVHADLKLLETNWSDVTGQAADDMLLEHLDQLRTRLTALLENDPLDIFHRFIISAGNGSLRTWVDQLSASDLVRIHQARASEITSLFREIRRTINDIHRRGLERQAGLAGATFDGEPDELADAEPRDVPDHDLTDDDLTDDELLEKELRVLDLPEPHRTSLNKPEQPQPASSRKEQEKLNPKPAKKKSAEQPEQPDLDDLDELDPGLFEAEEDPERFLKQLLDVLEDAKRKTFGPDQPEDRAYADAAGG